MRYICAVVMLVVVGWSIATISRIEGGMAHMLDSADRALARNYMKTLPFSKTLDDGTTVSYTAMQAAGETLEAFAVRARAEWDEICVGLGD